MIIMRFAILFLAFAFIQITPSDEITLTVNITNIEKEKGKIRLGIFTNQADFKKEKPFREKAYRKASVKNGEMTVSCTLPKGTYGISLLDDENNDGKMNYSKIGIPKEGFGFSNYISKGIKKPKFDDFDFELKKAGQSVKIKVRYL